jgi:hypothetical protein
LPAEYAVGFTLHLEGRDSGEEAELEQKLIFGQRHGNWKWALNLEHATEWEDNLDELEGEFGASLLSHCREARFRLPLAV